MEGVKPAVFGPRAAGQRRRAVLQEGLAEIRDGDLVLREEQPPLVVEFVVPDAVLMAKAEAAASEAMSHIRRTASHLATYGLSDAGVSPDDVPALARIVTAIETAVLLWKDWNFAELATDEAGVLLDPPQAVEVVITPANVARLLEDANIRAAWSAHLDAASPLERAEGNVYAASPNGSSEGAAITAGAAPTS